MRTLPFLFGIIMLAACAGEEPRSERFGADRSRAGDADTSDADTLQGVEQGEVARDTAQEDIVASGDAASATLTSELMGRVAAAIRSGGPASAIDFCSEEALPRTSAVAEQLGVEIKRTSARVRNPQNAPDSYEQAALAHFEAEIEAGNPLPSHYVQQAGGETRYYRPIVVAELCTTCHGPRDSLDPLVREALDRRYPNDQATGYRAGDFRGLVRVSLPPR